MGNSEGVLEKAVLDFNEGFKMISGPLPKRIVLLAKDIQHLIANRVLITQFADRLDKEFPMPVVITDKSKYSRAKSDHEVEVSYFFNGEATQADS